MALDPYAPCPCGNGQKIKFCCSADITNELDKVLRSIEGDQRAAALDQLNRLLATRPTNPALLAIKGSVQLSMNEFDEAEKTIHQFLAVDPKNPTALAQGATISALRGNTRQAVERLQAALEEADGRINRQVHETIHLVGDMLLSQGDILGAYGHIMLYASTADPRDEEARLALSRIRASGELPLFLRQERYLEDAPDGVSWKPRFDEAMMLASKACWLKACEQLIVLAERVPNEPRIIRNIAVLRGYLGDTSGAMLWWRKYASLEAVPLEDRVEAEALAQLLDPSASKDRIDVVQATTNLSNVDRAMEKLLSDKRFVAENRDAYLAQLEEGEVPPKAVFTVLDRPMPPSGVDIKLEDMPRSIAELMVYGRQTDREANVQLTGERTASFNAARQALAETLGDAAAGEPNEEVLGQAPAEIVALRLTLYPPRDIEREHFRGLLDQARQNVLMEDWPRLNNRYLDQKTPEEAAANPHYRVRVLGAILLLEQQNANRGVDFNALRARLGLPTLGPIDPAGVDLVRLPAWRLARLVVDQLSDDQLLMAFQRAVYYFDMSTIARFGEAILARPAMAEKIDPMEVYGLMTRFAPTVEESAQNAVRAQEYARSQKESPAHFMLMELQARIAMGDGKATQRLIETLSTVHRNEPGVSQALMQIFVQLGIVTPDGRMRAAPPQAAEAAAPGGLWTPGQPVAAPQAEKKSGLWLPE